LASQRPFCLAWVLADRGALEEAARVASELLEMGRARRLRMEEARGSWVLAEVLRRRGDLAAAERAARRAIELLSFVPVEHLAAKATLAAILLSQGRRAEARAWAEEAMATYAACGDCGLFRGAMVRLVHAESLWATGDREPARAAIAAARERLLVIAERIKDGSRRAGFLSAVPENARTLELHRDWCSA
jgi:ATP/maltotriose-dependent transcriptional regulator MalT